MALLTPFSFLGSGAVDGWTVASSHALICGSVYLAMEKRYVRSNRMKRNVSTDHVRLQSNKVIMTS